MMRNIAACHTRDVRSLAAKYLRLHRMIQRRVTYSYGRLDVLTRHDASCAHEVYRMLKHTGDLRATLAELGRRNGHVYLAARADVRLVLHRWGELPLDTILPH